MNEEIVAKFDNYVRTSLRWRKLCCDSDQHKAFEGVRLFNG